MIRFSVITVCLNAGQDLLSTVQRTLDQTYPHFEIIVKDAGSMDGSVERLPKDPRIRVVTREDAGIYDAMNQGIEAASGDYMIFMNCGDWFYDKNALQAIADAIGEDHQPVYYGKCFDRMTGQVRAYPRELTRLTCYRTMICHQATIYRADILKNRPYDLSYPILADRETLWYLVCKEKVKPVYIEAVIADYQGGGESASEKYISRNKADQKRLLKIYYSRTEQLKYKLMMGMTFQKFRVALSKDPKYSKYYYKTVQSIYDLKEKIRK